ncbi:cell division protein FtsQ/DivIB [Flavobacterium chuncheonense]|uniref:Cell division protein FtsQ/DivIB n=1 Tax=Flavobacterium chuncheonense TaxID=2026653 RepID=A0ABW5YL00_9FLAO
MKSINWHNVRLVLILLVMVFLYSFSSNRNKKRPINEVTVSFAAGQDNLFITHEMVNNLLKQNFGSLSNIAKVKVDLNSVEAILDNHEMIEKAEVFSSIDGSLSAHIIQKTPTVRFLSNNTSYYLDSKGDKMPLSENFSARVPLVVGSFFDVNKEGYVELFNKIEKDDFLKKDITGVKILPSGSVILTNRNYNYKIVFGNPVQIDKKLRNYKAFYQHAIKDTLLKEYKEVNLMFTEQVVCKK